MNTHTEKVLENNDYYTFYLTEDDAVLVFDWKPIKGLSINSFQSAIAEFAAQCEQHKPTRAVIDAAALDQQSPAVAWLRGQNNEEGEPEYLSWWMSNIVPHYNNAGILSLAVGTGDPNAPGELPEAGPEVNFKMGYFQDFATAIQWQCS
ncbi:MAG: hypothetical protein ACRBHB_12290 [Arenicella sp.]